MGTGQSRIVVSRTTTWARLMDEVAKRDGQPYLVVGVGARPRRYLDRLVREIPNARRVQGRDPREHIVIVDPDGQGPLLWGSDELGEPPQLWRLG